MAPRARPAAPGRQSASSSPLATLCGSYASTTPRKLKLVDSLLAFLVLSGVLQFVYAVLVTNFPFNSFLAGFASTVGQFVLAASLRMQANPANQATYASISPERYV